MLQRPRFCRKSVPDGIFKMPTAAKRPQYRARRTGVLHSTGRGNLFLKRRQGFSWGEGGAFCNSRGETFREVKAGAFHNSRGSAFPGAEAGHSVIAEAMHFFRRARWIYKMSSDGRDFPGKVRQMAFSKCRRPRKDRNIAPGGQVFCIPPGAVHSDGAASGELEMFRLRG